MQFDAGSELTYSIYLPLDPLPRWTLHRGDMPPPRMIGCASAAYGTVDVRDPKALGLADDAAGACRNLTEASTLPYQSPTG
jgi:hypothetical protein